MSLSKKNLNKLKSYLDKSELSNEKLPLKSKNNFNSQSNHNESTDFKNPNDIFYSIIDNANNLEETSLNNSLLKRSEENITKINKDQNDINSISNTKFNNQNELSNEELLYDEFNYLLDE